VLREMMKSKLHRGVVTDANLKYMGSITIDSELMEAADLLPHEKVQVVNLNNGERFTTYVIAGEVGKGDICLNGAAARLVQPGDEVIIISYVWMEEKEIEGYKPSVIFLDENNRIISGQESH